MTWGLLPIMLPRRPIEPTHFSWVMPLGQPGDLLCRLGMIFCVAQQGRIHAMHCLKCLTPIVCDIYLVCVY